MRNKSLSRSAAAAAAVTFAAALMLLAGCQKKAAPAPAQAQPQPSAIQKGPQFQKVSDKVANAQVKPAAPSTPAPSAIKTPAGTSSVKTGVKAKVTPSPVKPTAVKATATSRVPAMAGPDGPRMVTSLPCRDPRGRVRAGW